MKTRVKVIFEISEKIGDKNRDKRLRAYKIFVCEKFRDVRELQLKLLWVLLTDRERESETDIQVKVYIKSKNKLIYISFSWKSSKKKFFSSYLNSILFLAQYLPEICRNRH